MCCTHPNGASSAVTRAFPNRLVTERLILRPPTLADAPDVLAAVTASYPELHRWMPWANGPYGIEQARQFCTDAQAKLEQGGEFTTLMTLGEDGRIVGSAGLTEHAVTVPSFEVGYWVHSAHTGRGLATEAAACLTRLAFEDYGAKRVELRIAGRNRRSQAVAERLGFELEATLRAHGRDNAGRLDALVYAMFDVASLKAAVRD